MEALSATLEAFLSEIRVDVKALRQDVISIKGHLQLDRKQAAELDRPASPKQVRYVAYV